MHINKLILTPIISGFRPIVINNPTPQRASLLITQRLQVVSKVEQDLASQKVLRAKLPKFLKKFVNIKTYVGSRY
ncbi:hypothetical protein IJ541_03935 [bacterium]|nr:hypothetical protein [bacterium]